MEPTREGKLVRIFIGEEDRHEGVPLYEWILRCARREGLATLEKVEVRFYRSGRSGADSG